MRLNGDGLSQVPYLTVLLLFCLGGVACDGQQGTPEGYPPDATGWGCFYAPLQYEPISCKTHSNCPSFAPVKCMGEWSCVDGWCIYGSTLGMCEVPDTNCPSGSACLLAKKDVDTGNVKADMRRMCTRNPIPCTLTEDCPALPPGGLTQGEWSCTGGTCSFPGYDPLP